MPVAIRLPDGNYMFYSVWTGHTILFIGCTILSTCIQSRPVLIKRFLSEHTDRIMTGSDERQTHIAAINRTIAGKILPRMPEPGNWPTVIPGLILYRRDRNYLSENCFYPPSRPSSRDSGIRFSGNGNTITRKGNVSSTAWMSPVSITTRKPLPKNLFSPFRCR